MEQKSTAIPLKADKVNPTYADPTYLACVLRGCVGAHLLARNGRVQPCGTLLIADNGKGHLVENVRLRSAKVQIAPAAGLHGGTDKAFAAIFPRQTNRADTFIELHRLIGPDQRNVIRYRLRGKSGMGQKLSYDVRLGVTGIGPCG